MKKLIFVLFLATSYSLVAQLPEPKNILFFLYDGVEILDFTGPMEVFAAAGYKVYTVADKDTITSRGILKVVPDYNFTKPSDYPKPDIVAVFGGAAHMQWEDETHQQFLKATTVNSAIDFSVCDGAFYFGGIGLLDGKTTTTYHWLVSELQKKFPKTTVLPGVRYVDNGDLVTTAGVSAGIDGAFYLVSKLKGESFAEFVAKRIEYDHWKPGFGKVIESDIALKIKQEGFISVVKNGQPLPLHRGEIANLGRWFLAEKRFAEAAAAFGFLIKNYKATHLDYSDLAAAMKGEGKAAPPTKAEFLRLVDEKGGKAAQTVFQETKKQYPNWQFLDPDALLFIGYYNYQNVGKLDEALDIFELNYAMFPEYHYSLAYQAEVFALKGDKSNAIRLMRQVQALMPTESYFEERIKELEN